VGTIRYTCYVLRKTEAEEPDSNTGVRIPPCRRTKMHGPPPPDSKSMRIILFVITIIQKDEGMIT